MVSNQNNYRYGNEDHSESIAYFKQCAWAVLINLVVLAIFNFVNENPCMTMSGWETTTLQVRASYTWMFIHRTGENLLISSLAQDHFKLCHCFNIKFVTSCQIPNQLFSIDSKRFCSLLSCYVSNFLIPFPLQWAAPFW